MGVTTKKSFEHAALIYASVEGFLEYLAPFVTESVERGDPVFVAVSSKPLAALREAAGDHADGVLWADTTQWNPTPMPRLRAFHELAVQELTRGAQHLRLIGEPVWPQYLTDETLEWQRHESVLNEVLGGFPLTLVCTYDAGRLSSEIVNAAERTHPQVASNGKQHKSPHFEEPSDLLQKWTHKVEDPPPSAAHLGRFRDLAETRQFLRRQAADAGLGPHRTENLVLAANEVLTNALVHGKGVEKLAVWTVNQRFFCQIEDRGGEIGDALVGYRPPSTDVVHGRGLWVARQLVDLVQIDRGRYGTRVRLQVRISS